MKITIGITTFNRINYLEKLAQSLYLSKQLECCNIRIYDDCSTEYALAELKQLFPNAAEIILRETNLGADENMRQMFVSFLETSDELLIILDSDLLCRPDWVSFINGHFGYTDGILSLYNSAFHRPIRRVAVNGTYFFEKEHVGAAGTVIDRETVQDIVTKIRCADGYDWAWSALQRRQGKRLLVSAESYFQHIGLKGHNCDGLSTFDFALNFKPVHAANQQFLADWLQEAQSLRRQFIRNSSTSYNNKTKT